MKIPYDQNVRTIKTQQLLRSSSYRRNTDRGVVTEMGFKLFFSFVIGFAGAASIVKLIPHYNIQQGKLQELRLQVKETEIRVSQLRNKLNRNFDPQQTQNLIEEYGSLTTPNRIQVFIRDDNNLVISDSQESYHPNKTN